MFESLFKKVLSKNLYFASLKRCVTKESISNKNRYNYGFESINKIILVRKITKDYHECYQDIFTKTIYKFDFDYCEIGEILINKTVPVQSLGPYIKYNDVIDALAKLNSEDYEQATMKQDIKIHSKNKKY